MTQINFASEKPSIKVRLCGEDVQFVNGVLTLDDTISEQNEQLKELRWKLQHPDYIGMAQLIRELDTGRAEAIAKKHMEFTNAKHRLAHGGLNSMSQDMQSAQTGATQAALEDTMRSSGASDEQIAAAAEELAKDGLVLTEKTAGQAPFRQPREGFIPSASGASAGTGEQEGQAPNGPRIQLPPGATVPQKPVLPAKPPITQA